MNEIIIQFSLIEFIKSLKTSDSKLKNEAIQEFINLNEQRKQRGVSHYIDVFREMGLSEVEKRNYYAEKGR